jgi:hypothetical protein
VYNDFALSPPSQSDSLHGNQPSSPPQIQSHVKIDSSQPTDNSQIGTGSTQSTNKENITPAQTSSAPSARNDPQPQILDLLSSIKQTLTTYFSQYPPHTIQRLAELILSPKQHYRSLPSYLHAVDRVVHVTSPANIYPLPAAVPDAAGAKILSNGLGVAPETISWGTSTQVSPTLGSDESLGGALLTPIPWLRPAAVKDFEGEVKTESKETIDGPNGAGSIETVSVSVNGISSTTLAHLPDGNDNNGAVTQGELLVLERAAGVVPESTSRLNNESEEEEFPHARGPEEIGMEDMGPQGKSNSFASGVQGIDVEAAVGRKAAMRDEMEEEEPGHDHEHTERPATPKHKAEDEGGREERKRSRSGTDIDMDVDDVDVEAQINEDEDMEDEKQSE